MIEPDSQSSENNSENKSLSHRANDLSDDTSEATINVINNDTIHSKDTLDMEEEEDLECSKSKLDQIENQDDEIKGDPLLLSLLVEPDERQPSDIENIITYLNRIDACSQFSCNMLKAMAEVAILASTDSQNTIILQDNEELDSWNVIIQGMVWVKSTETDKILQRLTDGQCFGVIASREKQTHTNLLISATDNCQFLCVSKDDFCRIAEDSKLKLQEHLEDSKVVMVTEHRSLNHGKKQGHVIIKATPKKLLENLIDSSFMVDPTYVEDFVICQRVFFKDFSETTAQLLEWLEMTGLADKAVKIIILWINYCYEDFQDEPELVQFLKDFIAKLKKKNMKGPLRFIHIACAGRTVATTAHYINSSFGQGCLFSDIKLVGGLGTSFSVYITRVTPNGDASKAGLCEGDEIIAINKKSTETMTSAEVDSLIGSSKYITITYKRCVTTQLIMQDQIDALDNNLDTFAMESKKRNHLFSSHTVRSVSQIEPTPVSSPDDSTGNIEITSTGGAISGKKKLKKFLRLKMFTRTLKLMSNETRTKAVSDSNKNASVQNPDYIPVDILYNKNYSISITNNKKFFDGLLDRSLTITKILKLDSTWKTIIFDTKVTASEILKTFNENDELHSLSCLTMDPETFETSEYTFQPQENCLQKFENYNSRFYIRKESSNVVNNIEPAISDIRREISCDFIDLDPTIVAKAISISNLDCFTRIKVREYIYSIFEIKNKEKYPNLSHFVEHCNLELYWVINEILNEPTIAGRAKIIQNFIKIAYICRELKNLNSIFFIISGLMHSAVKALTTTWEKVLPKYIKMYNNLQQLLDPSRNMMKYRAKLNDKSRPTILPIFPVLQKDLTFINDGNSTWYEDLINFEKLRMISQEIRNITQYYSCTFDYMQLFTTKGTDTFKCSFYLQLPFRPQYLIQDKHCDKVPLSGLGMSNFSTKSNHLHSEQVRLITQFATHHKFLPKEYHMEARVFKYIETRFSSLETTKEELVNRAKFIEANATTVPNAKRSDAKSGYLTLRSEKRKSPLGSLLDQCTISKSETTPNVPNAVAAADDQEGNNKISASTASVASNIPNQSLDNDDGSFI